MNARMRACMHALAKLLRTKGDVTESEEMFSEVVKLRTAHPDFGADHPDALSSRRELAVLWRLQGKLPEADTELNAVVQKRHDPIVHAEQVAELSEEELKPIHLAVCDDMYAMVEVLTSQRLDADRRLLMAANLVNEVIEGRTKLLGERHAHTFDARILRGQVRVASGSRRGSKNGA